MKQTTLISAMAFLMILMQPALAASQNRIPRRMADDWAIGSIQYLGRNTIDIFDEKLRMDRRFTYFGSQRELQVGERVRIFFDPDSRVVRIIKKITPLEYRQDGQNLGYIHHK